MSKRGRHTATKRELLAIIERLEKRIAEQNQRIAELEAEVARLRKNSSTSSKPPSSDIVKAPKRPKANAGRQTLKAERLSDCREDVRSARQEEMAGQLSFHESLVYELASHRAPILTTDLRRLYEKDCRRKGIRPVARRTFSKYVGVLRNRGLLDVDEGTTPGKGRLLRRPGGVPRGHLPSGRAVITTRT